MPDGAPPPWNTWRIGTSDSIRDTEPENVRAYFQAAHDYGNYANLGRK